MEVAVLDVKVVVPGAETDVDMVVYQVVKMTVAQVVLCNALLNAVQVAMLSVDRHAHHNVVRLVVLDVEDAILDAIADAKVLAKPAAADAEITAQEHVRQTAHLPA